MKNYHYLLIAIMVIALGTFAWQLKKLNSLTIANQGVGDQVQPQRCSWSPGDMAAFKLTSDASVQGQTDHFSAVMSWEIAAVEEGIATIRAALSDIQLSQDLTQPEERANLREGMPFFLQVNADCLVVDSGFADGWDANSINLVRAQLSNLVFTLPPQQQQPWTESLTDGIGEYQGWFSLQSTDPLTVSRQKMTTQGYSDRQQFGVQVDLKASQAVATYDPLRPAWWAQISGQEELFIQVAGDGFSLQQTFTLERDDSLFRLVPLAAVTEALFGALALEQSATAKLPPTKHQSYNAARQSFADYIYRPVPSYVKAAMELAAWLKANPADVDLIVDELRNGLEDQARPTVFLALELSGTEEAKQALIMLLDDYALSEADQAAAASALVDLGEPSREVAEILLARASQNDMAANVSQLGVGTLLSRAKEPELQDFLRTSIRSQYQASNNTQDVMVAIDTVSNTRDQSLVDILAQEINSDSQFVRQSSASAIATVAPDNASELLIERLRQESVAGVNASLVKALTKIEQPLPQAIPVMEQKLSAGDKQVRSAVIDWLGSQDSSEARALLAKQYQQEPSLQLKQKIGRYVPASALR